MLNEQGCEPRTRHAIRVLDVGRRGWHIFLVNVLVTQGGTFVLGEEGESNEVVHFLVEVLGAL